MMIFHFWFWNKIGNHLIRVPDFSEQRAMKFAAQKFSKKAAEIRKLVKVIAHVVPVLKAWTLSFSINHSESSWHVDFTDLYWGNEDEQKVSEGDVIWFWSLFSILYHIIEYTNIYRGKIEKSGCCLYMAKLKKIDK
jgi:hypothetical protein